MKFHIVANRTNDIRQRIIVAIYYEVKKGHMRSVSIELLISYEIDRLYVRRVSSSSVPRRMSPRFLL